MPSSPNGPDPRADRFTRMRGDAEGLLSSAARRLSRIKIPFKAPSLLDRSKPYFSGIKRFGISKFQHYWQDPFHTLLNLPWGRFIAIFFLTYLIEFMVFAFLFWAQSDRCIIGMDGKFAHALWMSSRTASTLGFDQIHPNPECVITNLTIMLQVIASSLVNFIMLGLVFARFSAPFKRATTIRFSAVMVCNRHPASGYWCVSLRVANIRKHQILKPSVRMLVTAVDSITPSNYLFEHLAIEGLSTQETNLELGFPANVTHVIGPSSPLWNLSLLEMDTRMMEILVFVDGIDAMTSKNMTARHAYNTNEIHMNESFQPLHLEMRGSALGLDFSSFDLTALASVELLSEFNADPALAELPLPEVQSHMWHLRHMTFKRLTEREPAAAGGAVSAAAGGSSGLPPAGGGGTASATAAVAGGTSSAAMRAASLPHGGGGGGGGRYDGHGAAGGAAAVAPSSTNPFLTSGSTVGVAVQGAGGGGGGASSSSSSWMGFGMALQAPPPQPAGGHSPLPLSAFINSQSGLESFSDISHAHAHYHAQHAASSAGPGSAGGAGGGGAGAAAAAAPPPPPHARGWAPGAPQTHHAPRGGPGGAAVAVEMLPTSSAAVEPRGNGPLPPPMGR